MPDILADEIKFGPNAGHVTGRRGYCIFPAVIPWIWWDRETGGINRVACRSKHLIDNSIRRRGETGDRTIGWIHHQRLTVDDLERHLMKMHRMSINSGINDIPLFCIVQFDYFGYWYIIRLETAGINGRHGTPETIRYLHQRDNTRIVYDRNRTSCRNRFNKRAQIN